MLPLEIDVVWAVRQTWNTGQGRTYQPTHNLVFWLVESGRMQGTIDGVAHEVKAGEALLQFPGVARELRVLETVRWVSVALRTKGPIHAAKTPWHWTPEPEERGALVLAFEQILACKNASSLSGRWRCQGAARLLLGLCLEHAPQTDSPAWLQAALARIEAQPQTDLTALAADSGYSPTQFRVRFRQHVGVAPADYAAQCLSNKARQLVGETDWPVKRLAQELDFASASHFCRFFKRRFGVSPGEFRRGGA